MLHIETQANWRRNRKNEKQMAAIHRCIGSWLQHEWILVLGGPQVNTVCVWAHVHTLSEISYLKCAVVARVYGHARSLVSLFCMNDFVCTVLASKSYICAYKSRKVKSTTHTHTHQCTRRIVNVVDNNMPHCVRTVLYNNLFKSLEKCTRSSHCMKTFHGMRSDRENTCACAVRTHTVCTHEELMKC